MDKSSKINVLYKIAMGESVSLSTAEKIELSRYKVGYVGKPLTTKGNIGQYITDVDKGYRKSFYDWCLDNNMGDRRTKSGSSSAIKSFNREQNIGVMLVGWLVWGLAIYWILNERISAGGCAIIGALVSVVVFRLKREAAGFTCFLLPIILAVIFGSR